MIVGLGTDIVQIDRFALAMDRRGYRLVQRLFTAAERSYCSSRPDPVQHYAARFAAKEAAMKALGTGWREGVRWRDIEITRETSGRPRLRLMGSAAEKALALGGGPMHLSLSHDRTQAVAVVILEEVSDGR